MCKELPMVRAFSPGMVGLDNYTVQVSLIDADTCNRMRGGRFSPVYLETGGDLILPLRELLAEEVVPAAFRNLKFGDGDEFILVYVPLLSHLRAERRSIQSKHIQLLHHKVSTPSMWRQVFK